MEDSVPVSLEETLTEYLARMQHSLLFHIKDFICNMSLSVVVDAPTKVTRTKQDEIEQTIYALGNQYAASQYGFCNFINQTNKSFHYLALPTR